MRPLIGITSRYLDTSTAKLVGNGTFAPYVDAIRSAGGAPVIIPLSSEPGAWVPAVVETLHGVLFTGGEDIAPHRYGAAPHPAIGKTSELRDEVEFAVFKAAESRGLPILGICRGLQFINVARGGTLYQDLPSELPDATGHAQGSTAWCDASHAVTVSPKSRLSELMGTQHCKINSLHHQAIKELGRDLTIVGRCSADNTIEAVEGITAAPWLLAVQWHPEVLWQSDTEGAPHLAIFRAFVEAAGRYQQAQ